MSLAKISRTISLATLISACGLASAQSWTLIDLGSLRGESHAFAITAGGVALGSATVDGVDFAAVRLAPGTDPDRLPPLAGARQHVAFGADGAGRIVGAAYNLGDLDARGFMVSGSSVIDLGALIPRAINASSQIAGITQVTTTDGLHLPAACVLSGGTLTILPTLGGSHGAAMGIDEVGRAVGEAATAGDVSNRPVMWAGGTAHDLGTLGGAAGQARAALGGVVVGRSALAGGVQHATRWTVNASGQPLSHTDLGTRIPGESSVALGMDGHGNVVGSSGFRAVLWPSGGGIVDLTTAAPGPGWTLERAEAISDSGVIVGTGSLLGYPRAFMLVPAPACDADYNRDGNEDQDDVAYLINAIAGGGDPAGALSLDFNRDGNQDQGDVIDLINRVAGGGCP